MAKKGLVSRIRAGLQAFQEKFMITQDAADPFDDFASWEARRLRYAILWAFYQNTIYRNINTWATAYRTEYSLYKYTRPIYNPTRRLANFWKTHLQGGRLTMDEKVKSFKFLPIEFGEKAEAKLLFPAIQKLWEWSNWLRQRSLYYLYGPVLGDVGLKIVDDIDREKVYIEIVHPGTVEDVVLDPFGNVKGYTITEQRIDPDSPNKTAWYKEVVSRDEEKGSPTVFYKTFKNNVLFDWSGDSSDKSNGGEWQIDYGFVPFVWVNHVSNGLAYGESEIHSNRVLFHELDDMASALNDHVRKSLNSPKLFTGIKKRSSISAATSDSFTDRPDPGRENIIALYTGNENAKALSLIEPLDYDGVIRDVELMLNNIEKEYPELRLDALEAEGKPLSGRALKIAREPTQTKGDEYRVPYDAGLVTAHQMGIAIAGFRKYKDFKKFNLKSFEAGRLTHMIGARPMFNTDPSDELEEDKLFFETASAASNAGIDLLIFLKQKGWSDEDIKEVRESERYQAILAGLTFTLRDDEGLDEIEEG